jgi:peroxiredoxin
MHTLPVSFWTLVGILVIGAAVAVHGQDNASSSDRPVEKQLKEMAEGVKKNAPDAAQVFEDGIKQIAATGIVERAPKVGDMAKMFELPDSSGNSVRLADLLKRGPVVLTWYRGGWCPYCNISLRGLLQAEPKIREQGATLVALTPELPDMAADTAKKNALTFVVLTDKGNDVARQYKIAYRVPDHMLALMKAFKVDLVSRNGDTSDELPLGVTYVIDPKGVIRWSFVDADYRKRAEPSDVIEALRALNR